MQYLFFLQIFPGCNVSAMTLPTLTKNHQRQVYVTQLRKVYNELSQALEQVITDSNAVNLNESNFRRNGAEWFIRNYFKTAKICTGNSVQECFGSDYKNLNGAQVRLRSFVGSGANENSTWGTSAILADGASLYITNQYIVVDINGKQGPNILGRDLFDIMADDHGNIIIEGTMDNAISNFATRCTSATGATWYGACLAKIINDSWKMDY